MKKYFLIPVAAMLLTSTAAFAKTSVVPSVDANNRVTVTVKSDSGAENIYSILVMKAGEKAEDNIDAASISNAYKFETVKGTEKAELSFNVKSTDKRGLYQVITGGGELDGNVTYFAIPEDSVRAEALAKLNAATAGTVYGVISEYNNKVWVIDLSDARYTADSGNVLKSFVKTANGGLKSGGDAEKCFRIACALSEIRRAPANELLGLLNYHAEELGMTYSEAVSSGEEKVMTAFTYLAADADKNLINSPAQLDTVLKRAEALGKVNAATRKDMQQVIEKYAAELEISTAGDYTKLDKYEIVKLLVKENGKDYTTIKEFGDAFAAAVKAVKDNAKKPANTGGGGSSGSGGSGGGKSVGIAPNLNVTDPGSAVGTKGEKLSEYFDDLEGSRWAVSYIDYAAHKGIINGDGNGKFRPDDSISREEFLKIAIEALNIGKGAELPPMTLGYTDVTEDDWFTEYVKKGIYYGIINGISETEFGAGMALTRQDAAVILMRVKETAKLAFADAAEETEFTDGAEIAGYAKDAVVRLQKAGIINGYESGEFRPEGGITRAEAAKLIYMTLKSAEKL